MRRVLLIILATLLTLTDVGAQQLALNIEPTTIDFGSINEGNGITTRSFRATNISDKPITISKIISTCDCTVANYSDVVINTKESFEFKVSYDPNNRPGRFDRTLFIIVEGAEQPLEVRVMGRVLPRERSVEEVYYYDLGWGLRTTSTYAGFSYLEHGKRYEERISYYNASNRTLRLRLKSYKSSGNLAIEAPRRIKPHSFGDIILRYELPLSSGKYGALDDAYYIYINGKLAKYSITAHGIATDNFDEVDDILSPRAKYSKKIIKFGDVNVATMPLLSTLTLTNSGETPLVVRSVDCTNSNILKHSIRAGDEIAPGQTRAYDIELNITEEQLSKLKPSAESSAKSSSVPINAAISIVTNDPMMPYQLIRVTATCNSNEDENK